MKEYQMTGELMKGFLGNISYETVLSKETGQITIRAEFGKRQIEECTQEDRRACVRAWIRNTGKEPDDAMIDGMIQRQKTEINVSVFHNNAYLGCAHRDAMEKEIVISPKGASLGFRTWKFGGGVLRVVLHVYQVLNDHTPYSVTIAEDICGGRREMGQKSEVRG